jgi:transposase
MIKLVRAGRRAKQLAKEFEPTAQTIHDWAAQADLNATVCRRIYGIDAENFVHRL